MKNIFCCVFIHCVRSIEKPCSTRRKINDSVLTNTAASLLGEEEKGTTNLVVYEQIGSLR